MSDNAYRFIKQAGRGYGFYVTLRPSPVSSNTMLKSKSLFASFSSEKEESLFFSEEKNQKTLLSGAGSKIRDLAGKYMVSQEVSEI